MASIAIAETKPQGETSTLQLPSIFADHMILQRDRPVAIWGRDRPGQSVSIEFAGQSANAIADSEGHWRIELAAMPSSGNGRDLSIAGSESRVLKDVLVGEVWLASGQSNMGFTVQAAHNAKETMDSANDDQLRFFSVQNATAAQPQFDVAGRWDVTTPTSVQRFSAVAYFFAKDLRENLKCPVAILHSSWGGTSAQTWISIDALRREPPFSNYVTKWSDAMKNHQIVQKDPARIENYQRELALWQKEVAPTFNAAMKEYNVKGAQGPKPTPIRPEPSNPDPMGMPSPSARPSTPSVIFNAKIAPIVGYSMRGVIWYQGEANGSSGIEYRSLLPRLIEDWRARWNQGDFPFLIVQLAGWDMDRNPPPMHQWPWLREAQAMTRDSVPDVALAVAIDLGDPKDVHPAGKLGIGKRLALLARRIAYGEKIVTSGPKYASMTVEGSRVRVRFAEVGSGLVTGQAPWVAKGNEPLPLDRLIGFEIADEDHNWHAGTALIDGDSVIVSNAAVSKPVAVRYGWANAPRCNLYNREGLPAEPFRTDDWPMPTKR
jgi:sialate O-acetylesterase